MVIINYLKLYNFSTYEYTCEWMHTNFNHINITIISILHRFKYSLANLIVVYFPKHHNIRVLNEMGIIQVE